MDNQHGQPTWTTNMDNQHGQPTWTTNMDNQHGQPTWTLRTPVLFASSARRDPFRPKTTTMHFDADIRVLWEKKQAEQAAVTSKDIERHRKI
jgi:hypothetical protein